MNDFKYLGVIFSKNGRLINAIKENILLATKGLHSLRTSFREKMLPLDCQIEITNKTIEPILLYGAEVWGYENIGLIEKFQLKYLKSFLQIRQSTPNYMVYGETGKLPIEISIKTRMINYWKNLVTGNTDKISFQIYRAMLYDSEINGNLNYKWINKIKQILVETGNNNVWMEQFLDEKKYNSIKRTLHDQEIQRLNSLTKESNKGRSYASLNTSWGILPKIYEINHDNLFPLIKYRTSNHKLPVETGRYNDIPFHERSCPTCRDKIGDEYHFMLECQRFKKERKIYINNYFIKKPSMFKFVKLMNSNDSEQLNKVGKFCALIIKKVSV